MHSLMFCSLPFIVGVRHGRFTRVPSIFSAVGICHSSELGLNLSYKYLYQAIFCLNASYNVLRLFCQLLPHLRRLYKEIEYLN